MLRKWLLFFVIYVLFCSFGVAQSIYQIDTSNENYITRSIRMKIPENVDVVKGLLIMGNPWQGSVVNFVDDTMATAFAESIGFAMMGTGHWGRFNLEGEFDLFEFCIDSLAQLSGHPEILNAPVIFFGCSNGGQMAHAYNSLRPEKCIAFLVDKGGYYVNPIPDTLALKTPGMLVAGELDQQYRIDAINDLFYNNRPRGALWSHILFQGAGHTLVQETHQLFWMLAETACELRYPADQTPLDGPVALNDMDESKGWLSDSTGWMKGIIDVNQAENYTGAIESASWHLNQDLAFLFATHSSYNRIDDKAVISAKVADSGDLVTYHFEVGMDWDSIHVFDQSKQIGAYYGGGSASFGFDYILTQAGFSALFAKVYLVSADSSVTSIGFVFVKGGIESPSANNEFISCVQNEAPIIYPNPSRGLVNIRFPQTDQRFIEVFDSKGNKVSEAYCRDLKTQLFLKEKGVYIIKISVTNNTIVEKVVIE